MTSKAVQHWPKNLQTVTLDADTVLDDFGHEVLCRKIEIGKGAKVSSSFMFR